MTNTPATLDPELRAQFAALSEPDLRSHAHSLIDELGYDKGLSTMMHKGTDAMGHDKLVDTVTGFEQYKRDMPATLAKLDALIAEERAKAPTQAPKPRRAAKPANN